MPIYSVNVYSISLVATADAHAYNSLLSMSRAITSCVFFANLTFLLPVPLAGEPPIPSMLPRVVVPSTEPASEFDYELCGLDT